MKRILFAGLCFISITAFIFNSCVNDAKMSEILKVDSVHKILLTAEKKLHEINYDSIGKKYKLYQEYSGTIKEILNDFRTEENWPYICAYENVKKPFRNMFNRYNDFQVGIDSSRAHLDNLKHDVRKDLISKEEFDQFYIAEKLKAFVLFDDITACVNNAKREEANFDTVHPRIVRFINDFQKKTNKPKSKTR